MRSITDNEKRVYQTLVSGEAGRIGLVSTELAGVETAAIAAVERDGTTGDYVIVPVAVLVNDSIFAMLTPPHEGL